jgi:hypothetical protein
MGQIWGMENPVYCLHPFNLESEVGVCIGEWRYIGFTPPQMAFKVPESCDITLDGFLGKRLFK